MVISHLHCHEHQVELQITDFSHLLVGEGDHIDQDDHIDDKYVSHEHGGTFPPLIMIMMKLGWGVGWSKGWKKVCQNM